MKGILVDDNGDLMVRNSSLAIGNCAADITERMIAAWTGEFKEAPLLGGNVKRMIAGKPDPFWEGNIRAQLRAAGIPVSSLRVSGDVIELTIEE